MIQRELLCDACGTSVPLDAAGDKILAMREPASSPAAGRKTIRVGDVVVHQCADSAYLPPGSTSMSAEPR
jgi:hypothetical protein